MIEARSSSIQLRDYLAKKNLIRTPNDLFALPVGTILEAGKFSRLNAYDCILHPNGAHLFLESPRQTPVKDELAIVFRGIPASIKYHPGYWVHKVAYDPGLEITVIGFSGRGKKHRKFASNWAFVDFLSKQ